MIYAVIGAGPRTGTSWVMRKLEEAMLPVFWSDEFYEADAENPYGYYEADPKALLAQDGVIAKVWPGPLINQLSISRAVVIHRDRETQLASIREKMNGRDKEACEKLGLSAEDYIDLPSNFLDAGLTFEYQVYNTELLDDNIEGIIEYMSEPIERSIN